MAEIRNNGLYEYRVMEDGYVRIRRYIGNEIHVTIPDEFDGHPVTQLGMGSFRACENLQSVTLPKNLIYIGITAFQNCHQLIHADLPETLECIAMGAFRICDRLEQLVIPENVTQFGMRPFPTNSRFSLIVSPGSPAEAWALAHKYHVSDKQGDLVVLKLSGNF